MEMVLDPATFAGLAGLAALTGWALGRTRALAVGPPADLSAATHATSAREDGAIAAAGSPDTVEAAAACQRRASEERRAIFEQPLALNELHDHVCSIRRKERVFEQELSDTGMLALPLRDTGEACRYFGRSGQPTCPAPADGRCLSGGPCTPPGLTPSAGGAWTDFAPAGPQVSRASSFSP